MPIFIPVSCLKINPQVICPQSEVGDRWGVLGQRRRWCQAGGMRGGKRLLLVPERRRSRLRLWGKEEVSWIIH